MAPISPRAKRLAANLACDIDAVTGSGPGGRIIVSDILDCIAARSEEGSPMLELRYGVVRLRPEGNQLHRKSTVARSVVLAVFGSLAAIGAKRRPAKSWVRLRRPNFEAIDARVRGHQDSDELLAYADTHLSDAKTELVAGLFDRQPSGSVGSVEGLMIGIFCQVDIARQTLRYRIALNPLECSLTNLEQLVQVLHVELKSAEISTLN